jgi:hypothetical protein
LDFYELKADKFLKIKDKVLLKEGFFTFIFYILVLLSFVFLTVLILQTNLTEEYLHLRFIFALFFLVLIFLIFVFFMKKVFYLINLKVPENLNFCYNKVNSENNNAKDSNNFVRLANNSSSNIKFLDFTNNKLKNYFNFLNDNLSNLRDNNNNDKDPIDNKNKSSSINSNNVLLNLNNNKNNEILNSSIKNRIKQNNFISDNNIHINNNLNEKHTQQNLLNLNKTLGKNININAFLTKPNNFIIDDNVEGILIKRSVLNSLDYFANFNYFFLDRNAFDIFELKSNFKLKSLIIKEKESFEKQTYDELKILENEILMEKENRMAIELLNKNIFNFHGSKLNNNNSNKNINKNNTNNTDNNNSILNNKTKSQKNGEENFSKINNKNGLNSITPYSSSQSKKLAIGEALKAEFQPIMEKEEDLEDLKNKEKGKKKITKSEKSIEIKIQSNSSAIFSKYNSSDSNIIIPSIQNNTNTYIEFKDNINKGNNSFYNSDAEGSINGGKKLCFPIVKVSNGSNRGRDRLSDTRPAQAGTRTKRLSLFEEHEKPNLNELIVASDKNLAIAYIDNDIVSLNNCNSKSPINLKNSLNKNISDNNNNNLNNILNGNLNVNNFKKNSLINDTNLIANNLLTLDKPGNINYNNFKNARKRSRIFDKSLETLLLSENKNNQLNSEARKMPKNIFEADNVKGSKQANANINNLNNQILNKKRNSKIRNSVFSQENYDINNLINLALKTSKIKNKDSIMINAALGGTQNSKEKINNAFGTDLYIAKQLHKQNIDGSLFDYKQSVLKNSLRNGKGKGSNGTGILQSIDIPEEIQEKIKKALRVNNIRHTLQLDKDLKLGLEEEDEDLSESDKSSDSNKNSKISKDNNNIIKISKNNIKDKANQENTNNDKNDKNDKNIENENNKKDKTEFNKFNNYEKVIEINGDKKNKNNNTQENQSSFDYDIFPDSINYKENEERELNIKFKNSKNIINNSNDKNDVSIDEKKFVSKKNEN